MTGIKPETFVIMVQHFVNANVSYDYFIAFYSGCGTYIKGKHEIKEKNKTKKHMGFQFSQ